MSAAVKLNDVVALLIDLPDTKLLRGQVGTVIEINQHSKLLVEFTNAEGVAYSVAPIASANALVLRFHREVA